MTLRDKCFGQHLTTRYAADGQELRPPSPATSAMPPDRWKLLTPPAFPVMSPGSSIPRTAAWRLNRVACSVWRRSGFEIGADWQRTPPPRWRCLAAMLDDQAAGMFGRLAPASDARRVKTIILQTSRGGGPVSKRAGPGRSYKWSWGRGRIKPIGSNPPGPRVHHPGNARRSSGAMRASAWRAECLDRHRGAWRTSLPHCT